MRLIVPVYQGILRCKCGRALEAEVVRRQRGDRTSRRLSLKRIVVEYASQYILIVCYTRVGRLLGVGEELLNVLAAVEWRARRWRF